MSVSEGIVSAPVGLAEVASLIRTNNDVGSVCSYSGINIWSKRKPIRYSGVGVITDESVYKNVRYGLLETGSYLNFKQYGANDIISSGGYTILRYKSLDLLLPRGSAYNEPYRLSDFNGYNHNAISPLTVSRSGDGKPMYFYIQPGFQSSVGRTHAIITNFRNEIQYCARPQDLPGWTDNDHNLTWYDVLTNNTGQLIENGYSAYNIAVFMINAKLSLTNHTPIRGTDYIIFSTGIPFKYLYNDNTHSNSESGFTARISGGHITIQFDPTNFAALRTFLNGKTHIYSKLLLVTNQYGFNNNNAPISDCVSIDFDSSFTGQTFEVTSLPNVIPHTFYVYDNRMTTPYIFKYFGSSITNFDTNTFDYYRLTPAYSDAYKYQSESNHLLNSGTNMAELTYQSGAKPSNISEPQTYGPDCSITLSANNGVVLIKRTNNTFTTVPTNQYTPSISGVSVLSNKSAGYSVQGVKVTKASTDTSVNEIWVRVSKGKTLTARLTIANQTIDCAIRS